ncbi:DUF6461 domain-containing protein [Yinghuangia seranimata]|uniref:DUF6461 domain-containing protein n=1 Tax=Yinghuangia seranimata TaxID=408067 RepID=UPI00248BE86C|nr:DUF6461 domain-containing protein [Yinghuangia seranimata]MDI2130617.1 DUF6461 domain-containing protein [Yinghuangia seranimata]
MPGLSWRYAHLTDAVTLVFTRGTATLALHLDDSWYAEFSYAEDGRLVTAFDTAAGLADRKGDDPSRFDEALRDLGADPLTGDLGALTARELVLALAETLGASTPYDGSAWSLSPTQSSAQNTSLYTNVPVIQGS